MSQPRHELDIAPPENRLISQMKSTMR
ncbi:hypothetical protein ACVXHB_03875 [Escherichia coli]